MARILLIEEDDAVRRVMQLMLVHLGHTVVEEGAERRAPSFFALSPPTS